MKEDYYKKIRREKINQNANAFFMIVFYIILALMSGIHVISCIIIAFVANRVIRTIRHGDIKCSNQRTLNFIVLNLITFVIPWAIFGAIFTDEEVASLYISVCICINQLMVYLVAKFEAIGDDL